MKKLRKKVYLTAGYNTVSLGTGRKEFNPKKERPGLEYYIREAGQKTLTKIGGAKNVDEGVIGNFIAAKYNKQANLPGFFPYIDKGLRHIPAVRVEGACASGGLAVITGIRSILAETADVVLSMGVEVQNTVKAVYGADYLAAAGYYKDRKTGHAHFFPGQFSDRAGAYFEKYDREQARKAFAKWYSIMIENARLCETAQEHHNATSDLEKTALTEPNPKVFVDHLNVFDCSKVSDGASSIAILSEEGIKKTGIDKNDCIEVIGFGQAVEDISEKPVDPTRLTTVEAAIAKAFESAGITKDDLATIEIHDCFTIAAVLNMEAFGFAERGKGPEFILEGNTTRDGKIPINTTGGLIGWGHPVGATGVHQAVTIWEQLTGNAGKNQITINPDRPFGMTVNMGGDDKTVVAVIYKKP